jgi:hypothetical protein
MGLQRAMAVAREPNTCCSGFARMIGLPARVVAGVGWPGLWQYHLLKQRQQHVVSVLPPAVVSLRAGEPLPRHGHAPSAPALLAAAGLALSPLAHDHAGAANYLLRGSSLGRRCSRPGGRCGMAVGRGRAAAAQKVRHRSVLLYGVRREGVRLSKRFFKGPENGTLGMLGKSDDWMRLASCRREVLLG